MPRSSGARACGSARLIDNVLDFAKIERGTGVYEFRRGDLGEVVERAIDVYRRRARARRDEADDQDRPELPPIELDENAITLLC